MVLRSWLTICDGQKRKAVFTRIERLKSETLYNVIFPLWLVIFFPPYILIPLVGNLIIDGGIILIVLRLSHVHLPQRRLISSILLIWSFGFLADMIGAIGLIGLSVLFNELAYLVVNPNNAWERLFSVSVFLTVIGLIGLLIGWFSYRIFLKSDVNRGICRRIAITMGMITAPWMFLLPTTARTLKLIGIQTI